MREHHLSSPTALNELFLYRLTRLVGVAGSPVVRLCEGKYGITRREWRLIVALAGRGPLLSSELAKEVQLTRGLTSKAISELVEKGLITRTARPNDRRLADVGLTPAGRAIYDALFPEVVALNQSLLKGFNVDELDRLDDFLARLQLSAQQWIATAALPKADRRHRASRKRTPEL